MSDLRNHLSTGRRVTALLTGGHRVSGEVVATSDSVLELDTHSGLTVIRLEHLVAVVLEAVPVAGLDPDPGLSRSVAAKREPTPEEILSGREEGGDVDAPIRPQPLGLVPPFVQAQPLAPPQPDNRLPKPQSKDTPRPAGSRTPGRPWNDADLKALADAFQDGANDSQCAATHNRTRTQITILRQAFEAARGNIAEDRIPPVAQTWMTRWRKVLANR